MTLRTIPALVSAGLVETNAVDALERVAARYAVTLTPEMARLAGQDAAVKAQFVPHPEELVAHPDECADPIGDDPHTPVPGIVHRYSDRALLKLVQVCAVYCRFCFRRETVGPGDDAVLSASDTDRALAYVADHPEIWEVILTGGDPLVLSPRRLGDVLDTLGQIPHVRIVRLHTRVPMVAPARVDGELVAALRRFGRAVFVAVHANAATEFTPEAEAACARLVESGIPLLGQTVLLRGVNDTPAALEQLMRRFVENRIKPYYLHHADLAPGTHRFRTGIARGQALVEALRGHVSGLCQPTYVLDIPGGAGKVPLGRSAVSAPAPDGSRTVADRHGRLHRYPDLNEAADNADCCGAKTAVAGSDR